MTLNFRDYKLFENAHFRIEHAVSYRIAGYLMVVPAVPVGSLSEMSPASLSDLGPTLRLAVCAVESVVEPEIVYCAKFGESDGSVHFHVFPRTMSLTEAYLAENGPLEEIEGPKLLTWAHHKFTGPCEHGNVDEAIRLLRKHFSDVA